MVKILFETLESEEFETLESGIFQHGAGRVNSNFRIQESVQVKGRNNKLL